VPKITTRRWRILVLRIDADPKYFDAWSNRAVVYSFKAQYDLAIADLTQAIKLAPATPKGYKDRSISYYKKQNYDLALADLNELIRLDPTTAQNFAMRAEVYEKKNQKDRALADYKAAQKSDSANVFAKAGLARLGATP
jgi:tetratricopeptide (TPR) repeat protein